MAAVVGLQQRWDTHWLGAPEHDDDDVRADLGRVDPPAERSRLLHDGDRLVAAAWWWRPDDPTVLVDPDPAVDAVGACRDLVAWLGRAGAVQVEALSSDAPGWADVPGHTVRDLDEWVDLFVAGEDPDQQVVAQADGRPVGVALGKVFPDGTGWVA